MPAGRLPGLQTSPQAPCTPEEIIVPSLENVEWLPPIADRTRNSELEHYAKREIGSTPQYTAFLAECPWIMHADLEFDIGGSHIVDLQDLIYLIVSRDNSCRFCHGAAHLFMRIAGMPEAQIDQLEEDVETARIEPRIGRAMDFVRKISRSNPPPTRDDHVALRDVGFDEAAIRELALFTGVVIFHNRFGTLLALPPEAAERVNRSRFERLLHIPLRLLYRNTLARLRVTPKDVDQSLPLKDGPFGFLTSALSELPHNRVLRKILDEAWASPNLPARTKALIFAVIARGLGADSCEREARNLLAAEDPAFSEGVVDELIANLASPLLSGEEASILPYVRETIRYRPGVVQRRGQALRDSLSNAAFLETVGTAALANMVCRIALAIEPR